MSISKLSAKEKRRSKTMIYKFANDSHGHSDAEEGSFDAVDRGKHPQPPKGLWHFSTPRWEDLGGCGGETGAALPLHEQQRQAVNY